MFRNGLKKVGYRVLVLSDAERAVSRCDTNDHVADVVVFGCHSLGQSGLDAFNQFFELDTTKETPAILLVTEKQLPLARNAVLGGKRVAAKMPLKMKDFRALLRRLITA